MGQRTLTLRQGHREGTEILGKAGIGEASLDSWLLLSYVTGISRAAYYGDPDRILTEEEADRYETLIQKRAGRIPLQHLTGEQEFMGYTFLVNEHVLIPRQDTETLVEEALRRLKPGMHILDLCTGSGCILISLLKAGAKRLAEADVKPPWMSGCMQEKVMLTGIGTDLSGEALKVAAENAGRLDVRASFLKGDLFECVTGRYDMIVSNPPYIPTKVIEGLQEEVRLHDPYIALDGKEDGLYFYREIIKNSVYYIKKGGFLIFETGYDQGEAVSALMRDAGYSSVSIQKDLAGQDRVVCGSYHRAERKPV